MDINVQLAIVAVGGIKQLSTLKTLLGNIVSFPAEQKYRNISLEALRKRGLTSEGFNFLAGLGFEERDSRLLFRAEPDVKFYQAQSAIEELQRQASVVERVDAQEQSQAMGGSGRHQIAQQSPVQQVHIESSMGVTTALRTLADSGWECPICFTTQDDQGWNCPSNHQFCKECMRQHIDAVPFPRCPQCDYELAVRDLEEVGVAQTRIEAYQHGKLCKAVDTLAQGGEMLVRCTNGGCPNVVLLSSGDGRQQFSCTVCNAPSFCTVCRQSPYHFHGGCDSVQPLREQWLTWISGGREDYYGRARVAAEDDERNRVLYEGIARHNDLEADERWKAENCRLCPGCSRPISKVDGCDSMVCGRAYHGGDQQPGCGKEFDWQQAAPYVAHIERRALPQLQTERAKLRGRTVFHPFTDCNLCGGSGCGISGLRFRCIHCPAFDVCSACEPKLATVHAPDHVFEIVFESDFRCPWLPRGTRVRVVRSGERAPKSLTRTAVNQLEGLYGKIIARRRPPLEGYSVELELGQGTVVMDMEHLEPVLTSRAEAENLLIRTLDEDGEEPSLPAPVAIPEVADDTPYASESDEGEEFPRRAHGVQGLGRVDRLPHVGARRPQRPLRRRQPPMPRPFEGGSDFADFADDSPLSGEEMRPLGPPRPVRPPRRVLVGHRNVTS